MNNRHVVPSGTPPNMKSTSVFGYLLRLLIVLMAASLLSTLAVPQAMADQEVFGEKSSQETGPELSADTWAGNSLSGLDYAKQIFNDFGIFTLDDTNLNMHLYDGLAVGGDMQPSGNGINPRQSSSSYVAGTVKDGFSINSGFHGFYDTNSRQITTRDPETDWPTLYLSSANWDQAQSKNWQTEADNNAVHLKWSDDFVNFGRAASQLQSASNAIAAIGTRIDLNDSSTFPDGVKWGETGYLQFDVPAGTSIILSAEDFKNIGVLNFVSTDTTNIYDNATYVTVEGNIVQFPQWGVAYNGTKWADTAAHKDSHWYEGGLYASGPSMGIVYNMPDATSVTYQNSDTYPGHVLAPNADIATLSGNIDGALVGKSVTLNAELHRWGWQPDETPVPATASAKIHVHKYVEGLLNTAENGGIKAGDYTFNLVQVTAEEAETKFDPVTFDDGLDTDAYKELMQYPVLDTATINKGYESVEGEGNTDADAWFDEITYTEAGTYYYVVYEVNDGNVPDIVYDLDVALVTVEVKDVDGKLQATVSYQNDVPAKGTENARFINRYFNLFAEMSLNVTKHLEDKDGETVDTVPEFIFKVEPQDDAPMPSKVAPDGTVTNDTDGGVDVGTIDFSTAMARGQREFWYKITEVNGGKADIDYDSTVYWVHFNFTDEAIENDAVGPFYYTGPDRTHLQEQEADGANFVNHEKDTEPDPDPEPEPEPDPDPEPNPGPEPEKPNEPDRPGKTTTTTTTTRTTTKLSTTGTSVNLAVMAALLMAAAGGATALAKRHYRRNAQ